MQINSTDSRKIQKFIKDNSTLFNRIPPVRFSQNTQKLLSLIFIQIAKSYEIWKLNSNNISIIKYNKLNYDISYYPTEIQESILSKISKFVTVNFNIDNRNIILQIGYTNHSDSQINNIIKHLYSWLFVCSKFASEKCSQTLRICLSLTKCKKKLPNNSNEYISQINANTAYTYPCKENNELHIYREEEYFKVFIHETFHSFGLDFSSVNNSNSNAKILKLFNANCDVRIFETYCETWGELINIMYITHNSTKWYSNYNKWLDTLIKKTEDLVYTEIKFSMFQCAKVLNYYNISYIDFITNAPYNLSITEKYKDNTHVLSYYIIKSMFLFNLNEYITQCIAISGYTINFDKSTKIKENIEQYCNIVNELYKNKQYMDMLEILQIRFASNINSKIVNTTLRMSIYDI